MRKGSCKRVVDGVAAALIAVLLILLFLHTNRTVGRLSVRMEAAAQTAIDDILQKNWDHAVLTLQGAQEYFLMKKNTLMLFMDHGELAELELALRGSLELARVHDDAQILLELETVRVQAQTLRSIEQFSLFTLF